MQSSVVSFVVFVLVWTGALFGMRLRRTVPLDHLSTDAKDTIRLAVGLLVTMTSLVLGMLVSSAKTYFDSQRNVVAQMSSQIILLDNLLQTFGPDSKPLRIELRSDLEHAIDRIWPKEGPKLSRLKPGDYDKKVNAQIELLVPRNATEDSAKAQIVTNIQQLRQTYWLMFLNSEQTTVSLLLLAVVTAWLVTIFISFGMFAPPNSTVMVTLLICAMAVSAAIFIIMEMYSPFNGIMRISPVAVRDALIQMTAEQ
jgi:hypothetical protein